MKKMQVKVRNLGIAEALWRNKYSVSTISKLLGKFVPEALTIYPTYRFHIIGENMSSHDPKNSFSDNQKTFIHRKRRICFCAFRQLVIM